MTNKIKNEFEYKLIGIILYFILNTAGFSVLFFYSPRDLLFNENSETEKMKLKLYKDFAKNIYANINTPLIKNLTLTKDNEACPPGREQLILRNLYYSNFSKFYGNKSICIERFKDSLYTYRNYLKLSDDEFFNKNQKKCGKLVKDTDSYVYISNDTLCPLTHIEINGISRAKIFGEFYYQMSSGDKYLIPIYGNDINYPVIIDIEIANNYKVCLEKNIHKKELSCQFPDNNECFIKDNYEQIYNLDSNEEYYELNAKNLIKWNNPKSQGIYSLCKPNLNLNIFALGYVNFTQETLKEFEYFFPPDDYTNNPLYKAYKAFKSPKNLDNLFKLISVIILSWSLLHLIIQIILSFEKIRLRKIFIINGILLFLFKLLSFFGMLIYYFYFLSQVQIVNIIMLDKPRNKVIENYLTSRKSFIYKSFIICFIGFILICIDFIIFTFSYIMKWGASFKIEELKKAFKASDYLKAPNLKEGDDNHKDIKEISDFTNKNSISNEQHYILGGHHEPVPNNIKDRNKSDSKQDNNEEEIIDVNEKKIISNMSGNMTVSKNYFIDHNEITLKFICKNNINKSYMLSTKKDKTFENIIEILKEKNPELKDVNMKVLYNSDSIINKKKTIKENNINSDNNIIFIQN